MCHRRNIVSVQQPRMVFLGCQYVTMKQSSKKRLFTKLKLVKTHKFRQIIDNTFLVDLVFLTTALLYWPSIGKFMYN